MKKLFSTLVIMLLMLSMMVLVPQLYAEVATIWTDKDNYGPQETVTIFGSGLLANAEITITITAPDSSVATIPALTDEFGNFTAQHLLDGMEGTYTVTATDGTNTATTTFTEAPKVTATWADGDCEDIKVTASSLAPGKNYYITYTDPNGNLQRTTPTFPGPSAYTEYFVLDIALPKVLGTWTVKLYETPATKKDDDTVDIDKMVWTTDSTYATMKTSFAQGETLYIKAIGLVSGKYYNFRLDPPTGSSIYVFSSYQYVSGTELTGSYVLLTTAKTGEWKLHVRKADNAAGTSHEGHYVDRYFTVTVPTTVPITITSSPVTGAGFVKVDATPITTSQTFTWTIGSTHTLEALSPVAGSTGTQYVWMNWSDGGAQTHDYTVPSSSATVTANYKTQYLVSFTQTGSAVAPTVDYTAADTDPTGTVPFDVWVKAGSEISYTYEAIVAGDTDVQYVLTGVSPASPQTVNSPLTITGTYKTQYLVSFMQTGSAVALNVTYTADTDPTDTVPFIVWVKAGSQINYTYQAIVPGAPGVQYVLTGVSPASPQTVNSPLTITGTYKTQYYLTVVSPYDTPGGEAWYDEGDTPSATLDYGIEDLAPGQRAVFTGWSVDASGTGLTSDPITMNGPKTAVALWVIQWYLDVEVAPPVGTIPGEDWYNNCTSKTLTAPEYLPDENGISGVRYKFSNWDVDGTSAVGNPIDVHMDAPHVATAHYTVQYYLTVKTDPLGIANITGEGWYDPCTTVTLTAPLEPDTRYLFAYWTVNTNSMPFLDNVIEVHIDGPKTATAIYKDYLGHARQEVEDLKAYLTALRAANKIGKREYYYFMWGLNKIERDIARAMKQLDRERRGFNDRQKGFEDLRHAVMKIKRLIHQVENWARKGTIPAANATWIINELETIRMKLVNKAWAEALAEKALALKAIADAKALGKDTTKAEAEIVKVDRELAKAIQAIADGKYSQAIQHFKHAFTHSQHAVKKAYDPTWETEYKDWIDELEEEEP